MALPKVNNKIIRLILRSLPIVPGPEIYDIFIDLRRGGKKINAKIDQAYESLKDTSKLIEDLEKDLLERTEKVKILKEKYDEFSKLAEIEEEKVKPLLKQVETVISKGKKSERFISFFINILAGLFIFILGIILSPKITSWTQQQNNIEVSTSSSTDSMKHSSPKTFQENDSISHFSNNKMRNNTN